MPSPGDDPAIRRVLEAARAHGESLDVTVFGVSTHTAADAAAALGVELGQIVKSLVFVVPAESGEPEPVVCLVSGPDRVDVPRLAEAVTAPHIRRATASEAHALTGFAIGGIPPLGHRRPTRVVMDPNLMAWDVVWAAAGTPRAVFPVAPRTLGSMAGASVRSIAETAVGSQPGTSAATSGPPNDSDASDVVAGAG
jgi:prolyl-tRNA editing enzyme YbaK/EbsC (Cys-tRNA(Pro) deacylase)